MRYASPLVLPLVLLAACSQPARTPKTDPGKFDLAAERALLAVPPGADSPKALARIAGAAASGDARAAWVEIHYLIDLFDAARFAGDKDARALLFTALQLADTTGPAATNQVLDALLPLVDRVLTADRLHGGAQAARTLLEQDRTPAAARSELFARMTQLKGIARGAGPLAANARLRLAGFCARAFRDAVTAAPPFRPGILGYCLYPLYDSDPQPYFAEDPSARPPEPRWQDLATDLIALWSSVGDTKSRLRALGATLAGAFAMFAGEQRSVLPLPLDPVALGVPITASAAAYAWTPLVALGDGAKIAPAGELAKKIQPHLVADGRGRVALVLTAEAPGAAALTGAVAAGAAGARAVQLVVGYTQALKVPAGDYWSGRMNGDRVLRVGVVELALPNAPGAMGGGRGEARVGEWDPARASQKLHLLMTGSSWQLVAPTGALPSIAVGDVAELRVQLARVLAAYEDEDGLVLVPQPGATVGQIVAAATAAQVDDKGRRLFAALAIADTAPVVQEKGDLAARITRRAGARVLLEPDSLAGKTAAVRRCYQDALDKNPKLAGTFVLALKGGKATISSGPKDAALRKCVLERIGPTIEETKTPNVRVAVSPAREK